jgi:peptidoglycan hydrolase-like protein with peptidoglycan-binding domain
MKTNNLIAFAASLLLVMPVLAQAQVQGDINPNPNQSSCVNLQNNLQYRSTDVSTNGEVSKLQDFLQSQGYLASEPTGYFGLLTQAAVKKFQTASGILSYGYVGSVTRSKIAAASCGGVTQNPTPSPLPSGCRPGDLFSPTTGQSCSVVACTKEAKMCPDGSWVGRVGPSCAFAACPSTSGASVPTPVVTFEASPSSIGAQQSATLSWSTRNAERCVLQYGSKEQVVAVTGSKTVFPSETTTYKLWCANDNGTGKEGPSAYKTLTVSVEAPSCTLTANKSSYRLGETVTFSWTSKNATYAAFKQDPYGKDNLYLPGDKLDTSGTYSTKANVLGNPVNTLLVYNYNGSSSCSTTVSIQ